jgi:EAL domain-containing protein (putative c-di-GMP-specific phosphodiesterase class I)
MIDSDGSVLVPGEYLTAVERSGLMPRLTRVNVAMILQALVDYPEAVVSLNVSAGDLADDSLPRFIEEETRRRSIHPGRLVFEMPEGAVVANLSAARHWMQRLRPIGSRFVLDEFGAGLGLFNLLRDLEFEQVKLDGSIVKVLHANGDSKQFVSAVRSLVESQGCVAVASWVETEGLLKSVQEVGFSVGQGYHIEMPDPDLGRLVERYGVVPSETE